jgi:hypothetical protein
VTVQDVGPPGLADWRVCISSSGSELCVELLGPMGGACDLPWWHAVRIGADSRTVIRGPARTTSVEEVVAFVDDVLAGGAPRATARWRELG